MPAAGDAAHAATPHEERRKQDAAIAFAKQAQKLALRPSNGGGDGNEGKAAEAKWVTPFDPVVETTDGRRLPAIPVAEAAKLNRLKDEIEGREPQNPPQSKLRESRDGTRHGIVHGTTGPAEQSESPSAPLRESVPQSRTNPLFPPLPMYGPPTTLRRLHCAFFRTTSAVLSVCFLLAIVIGAVFDAIPKVVRTIRGNPRRQRPFYEEEVKRKQERKEASREWTARRKGTATPSGEKGECSEEEYIPTEGGPDPLVVDIAYYARRVGLDAELYEVQTVSPGGEYYLRGQD